MASIASLLSIQCLSSGRAWSSWHVLQQSFTSLTSLSPLTTVNRLQSSLSLGEHIRQETPSFLFIVTSLLLSAFGTRSIVLKSQTLTPSGIPTLKHLVATSSWTLLSNVAIAFL